MMTNNEKDAALCFVQLNNKAFSAKQLVNCVTKTCLQNPKRGNKNSVSGDDGHEM